MCYLILEVPVFVVSSDEAEEYKKSSLTGANVPYSEKDPRQALRNLNERDVTEGISMGLHSNLIKSYKTPESCF